MERLKHIIIIFLLTIVLPASAEQAKTPALLLQEGLYAEQTEGDLDKAIEIYGQVLEQASEIQRLAAKATYQLGMCYLKKGDETKAVEYFRQVVSNYPTQKIIAEKAQKQLGKIRPPETSKNLYGILGEGVCSYIGSKYGEICAEAGVKKLYSNSHIYFVDRNFELRWGGMGYIYNWTGKPITDNYRITGTTYPSQKLYDIQGNEMDIEIVPDEQRKDFYHIYWNPKEPLGPGEFFNYGWATDGIRKLSSIRGGAGYPLTMQNQYGDHCYETFFLVVPEGTVLDSQSENYTNMENLEGWDIYWWKKEVAPEMNHIVNVVLEPGEEKPLSLEATPWADGEVMELRLRHPGGGEYGTVIYSAQSNVLDDTNTWQVISHLYVTEGSLSQYTFVEAEVESFVPIYGQTTNWMGDFEAEYNNGNVKLTVGTEGKESRRDVSVEGIAYDNEQALYLIRRMPLAENYEGSFPIFAVQGSTVVECRIKVLGIEEVTVEAGTFKCYKTDLSIYVGNMRTLQHTLWFSADEHKYLVKYDVGGTATMEMAKVWQKDKDKPLTFENDEPHFSVTIPADWFFYRYGSGPQFSIQLIPPEVKAWAGFVWQRRGTDPDSASAMTIAKAECEKLKGFFENYTPEQAGWKEFEINGLEAAQYFANYQEKGSSLRKYTKPKEMVEYRTYIVDESNVYWFVFRIEKDKFEESKPEFDLIVTSFKDNAKSVIDLSTPEATIKSFVKAVYVGNLEAAKECVSKDGADYDEFKEILATESNHPFQAMIKAMDTSIPIEITSEDITEDRCKIKWYFTLGRVYYIGDGETKWKKGRHTEFSSYLELVDDKWLIRDI